jgi:hypothetical protein
VITLGAYLIGSWQQNKILITASFFLANITVLLAPWGGTEGIITKLSCSVVLGLITLFLFKKWNYPAGSMSIAIGNYLFLFLGSFVPSLVASAHFSGITALVTVGIGALLLLGTTYFLSKQQVRMYTIGTL